MDDGSFTNYAKHELAMSENSPNHESEDLYFLFDDWETNEINVSLKPNELSSENITKSGVEIKKDTETDKKSRFTEVDEQFVTNFVLEHENAKTKRKTLGYVKLQEEYLEKNDEMHPIHEEPAPSLYSISRFFLSIRQNNGSEYEPTTLRGMMGSFEQYLRRNRYNCSLVYSPEFYRAGEALKSIKKDLQKKGKGNKPKTDDVVTDDDIKKDCTNTRFWARAHHQVH